MEKLTETERVRLERIHLELCRIAMKYERQVRFYGSDIEEAITMAVDYYIANRESSCSLARRYYLCLLSARSRRLQMIEREEDPKGRTKYATQAVVRIW